MHYFSPERRRFGGALGALLGVLALLWGLLPGAARAQSAPWLVKDINASPGDSSGSNPENLIVAGKTAYFSAFDPRYGGELWKTDGTAPGTVMVKDIFPGMFSSWPQPLAAFGSTVYFSANDDVHGPELWKTDGTAAGTQLVKEIMPGFASPEAHDLVSVRGQILFTANDGPHGLELWRTDGTAAGTGMLKDFHPIHSGYPRGHTLLNGTDYFIASETYYNADNTRPALWKSDGAAAGTVRVMSTGNWLGTMGAVNGRLYLASSSYVGSECWMHFLSSDGTAAGTREFLSIRTDYAYSSVLPAPNGGACFVSRESTTTTLWLTDGTPQGTRALKKLVAPPPTTSSLPKPKLWALNGALYFCAEDAAHGMELWRTNGAGATLVKDIAPGKTSADPAQLTILGSRLYFTADDGVHGRELWRTDGTAVGTVMVKDIAPGSTLSNPTQLTIVGSRLYFLANDGVHGRELWRTDGTAAGTVMVKDIIPSGMDCIDYYDAPEYNTNIRNLRALNGRLIFTAFDSAHGGWELWTSDGTAAGTHVLKDIGAGSNAYISDPVACGNRAIYVTANDAVHGPELWKSDGRSAALVRDLRPGPLGGLATYYYDNITCKVCINDAIYFSATDGLHRIGLYRCDSLTGGVTPLKVGMNNLFMMAKRGNSLIFGHQGTPTTMDIWSTDGTKTGLKLLKRFTPLPPNPGGYYYNPAPMPVVAELKGVVYFGAPGMSFPGLWKSDGTAAGTMLVSRMNSDPNTYYSIDTWPSVIKSAGDKLFMIANNRLWVSDGTAAGTRPVIRNKSSLTVSEFETMAGKAWFRMSDPAYGDELWVSDGTEAGTRLVKDLWPGTVGSQPQYLLAVGNKLFFTAADPVHGVELWVSDGTVPGTRFVRDIAPGRTGAHPSALTPFGARVLFSAYDPVHGNELWVSDGTAAGTVLAAEVVPGALGSNPTPLGALGDTVLFSAQNSANPAQGYELWACKVGLPGTLRKWTSYGN